MRPHFLPWLDVFFWLANGPFSSLGERGWSHGCSISGGLGILVVVKGVSPLAGWLTYGDLAVDSCAHFLAFAEHRSIPSGARAINHQLRKAGHQSVWSPACQDQVAGGHAGVGVVTCGFANLCYLCVYGVLQAGKGYDSHSPHSYGGVVHLFVVYGYQGAEKYSEKLQQTDTLLQAVLAEVQVVCVGHPLLIACDLNADPAVVPCLAKSFSAGRFKDLALAYCLGAGDSRMPLASSDWMNVLVHVETSFLGCSNALAASTACSSHLRERDKMLLRAILYGAAWN